MVFQRNTFSKYVFANLEKFNKMKFWQFLKPKFDPKLKLQPPEFHQNFNFALLKFPKIKILTI